jgi:malate synthase
MVGSLQYQQGQFVQAICLFNRHVVSETFEEFLTWSAYDTILLQERNVGQEQPHETANLQTEPAQKHMPEHDYITQ